MLLAVFENSSRSISRATELIDACLLTADRKKVHLSLIYEQKITTIVRSRHFILKGKEQHSRKSLVIKSPISRHLMILYTCMLRYFKLTHNYKQHIVYCVQKTEISPFSTNWTAVMRLRNSARCSDSAQLPRVLSSQQGCQFLTLHCLYTDQTQNLSFDTIAAGCWLHLPAHAITGNAAQNCSVNA